jgi:PAS domain S-box-containing protein
VIHLDESEARARKAERAWHFNVVQVPTLRLLGFILISALVTIDQRSSVAPALIGTTLSGLIVLLMTYSLVSWGVLYLAYRPERRLDVGLLFLVLDVVVYTVTIYATGGEHSWLYLLFLVRVADQANTSFRRVLGFVHYDMACYLAMLAIIAHQRHLDVRAATLRFLTLYAVAIYVSFTARTAESLRQQTTEAIHMARRLLRDLEALGRQNQTILDFAPDGILGVDAKGCATLVNRAAARMLGATPSDLLEKDLEAALRWSRANGVRVGPDAPLKNVLESGLAWPTTEGIFWRKDGVPLPVDYAVAPIHDGERVNGAVVAFVDVTQRHEVARLKGEFVSMVSHELRTPLTSIRGSLGMLAGGVFGEMPAKGQRMLDIAVTNTDRLIRLINDILDIERMESGKIRMEMVRSRIPELVHQAVSGVRGIADRGEVAIEVDCSPIELEVDPDRIVQTLTNLLGNAIKFSSPGQTVVLRVKVDGERALFEVADDGRGIPPDKLELIFERFLQVDASDAREKGGTGLGLPICRSIVEQHGGRIWAENRAEGGSVFRFELPMRIAEEPSEAPAPIPLQLRKRGPLRVLIAEDDPDLAAVLAAIFERHQVQAHVAANGTEAIHLSQGIRPDLLVLDLGLPGHDGFQVAEWLRHYEGLGDLTVIVYTAQDLSEEEQAPLRVGHTIFLTKSRISPDEFERRIAALLE